MKFKVSFYTRNESQAFKFHLVQNFNYAKVTYQSYWKNWIFVVREKCIVEIYDTFNYTLTEVLITNPHIKSLE